MNKNSFLKLDKRLFMPPYHNLKPEYKLAYALLSDRYALSLHNEYVDEYGRTFVKFTEASMGDMLCCSRQKVGRIMQELEDRNMIERYLPTTGEAYYIYPLPLLHFVTATCDIVKHKHVMYCDTNDNKYNKTDIYDIDHKEVIAALMRVWEYDYVINHDEDLVGVVDAIINVAVDILCSSEDYMHIAGKNRSIKDIHDAIAKLTSVHIIFIARRIKDKQQKIKNMDSYIATALYNSGINVPG